MARLHIANLQNALAADFELAEAAAAEEEKSSVSAFCRFAMWSRAIETASRGVAGVQIFSPGKFA